MKEYPDPKQYFERHLAQAAEKRLRGFEQAGLTPSNTLINALIERDLEEGNQAYIKEGDKILEHNIKFRIRNYHQRNGQIKRSGARLRLWTCPPITLLLGFMAWYSFSHPGAVGIIMGLMYTIGALAFLGMLVLGAIFDRPSL